MITYKLGQYFITERYDNRGAKRVQILDKDKRVIVELSGVMRAKKLILGLIRG